MDIEQQKCFRCGEAGHLSANCPKHAQMQLTAPEIAVPWCGICDPRTRLMRGTEPTSRCPSCHPLRHKMLPQHARCKGCRKIIYAWDTADCGLHARLGPQDFIQLPADRTAAPHRESEAARQVAEFRASPAYPGTIPAHTPPPIANTLPGD